MKPRSASPLRQQAETKLVYLIEAGENVQRLRRGFADRFQRTAQIGQFALTDSDDQLAALTLRALLGRFILPWAFRQEPFMGEKEALSGVRLWTESPQNP